MKLTLATLTLVALTAATPPPEPVVHKPVPEKAIGGCYHYYVFPTPRQFKLGPPLTCNYYQFNEDAWKEKVNGYDPPWGCLGKKMHNMSSFCCRGWKAPKPVFPV
ncbi:hypothetical protein FOC4_g10012395 [Fusarium odoratissimum]|uniref:Secreted in xylem 9 n=1 Tax=Fusarium oxysporum f. sp. cubense (strain race 4) TaxID=2502994 RepID=N1RQZ2_FUSC4|nr:hypothetical protein FOC4_g10012395 [Fusarium odoratissimum]